MATATRPRVLLISLSLEPWFDEMYDQLLEKLGMKATIQRAKTPGAALRAISENAPSAILVTDAAPTTPEHTQVWDEILKHVRQGGTAVCMGHFSTFVKPLDMKPFFERAGLQWEAGAYERTTVALNRDAAGNDLAASLPLRYSQKAIFLKNVDSAAAWYRPNEDSVIESHVFAPTPATNLQETPVAFATVGMASSDTLAM